VKIHDADAAQLLEFSRDSRKLVLPLRGVKVKMDQLVEHYLLAALVLLETHPCLSFEPVMYV
jgi:hypothetical protein